MTPREPTDESSIPEHPPLVDAQGRPLPSTSPPKRRSSQKIFWGGIRDEYGPRRLIPQSFRWFAFILVVSIPLAWNYSDHWWPWVQQQYRHLVPSPQPPLPKAKQFAIAIARLEEDTNDDLRDLPLDWAKTQNNFGNALAILGERESGTKRLQEAVASYRLALEERTRDRVPLDWAMTQNNLGNALRILGERESGTTHLQESVTAFRLALEERTRERVPLDWAATQNNLGTALRMLGERESGTTRLQEAVAAYRLALDVFEASQAASYVEKTQRNLEQALELITKRAPQR